MKVWNWFTGLFSDRSKALSIYKRGMARAKRHEHEAAVDDYTAVIGMSDTPADVKAMALYNRALVYAAAGKSAAAADDLNVVLSMPQAPPNIKTEARRKLTRMQPRSKADSFE